MKLIINADDFGLSKSITDGIIEALKCGYITSTSLMVNMPFAKYAIDEAIKNNINCIGLHVNLTAGKPVLKNSNLVDGNGIFLYNKLQKENTKLTYEDVYNEIMAQLELVRKYSNGKIKVDHLDTHHYMFCNEIIKEVVIDIAKKLDIPVRNETNITQNVKKPDEIYTDFTMINVNVEKLKEMCKNYSSKDIVLELVTHCGYVDEYTKSITSYIDRENELKVLKEAKYLGIFDNIDLINFSMI